MAGTTPTTTYNFTDPQAQQLAGEVNQLAAEVQALRAQLEEVRYNDTYVNGLISTGTLPSRADIIALQTMTQNMLNTPPVPPQVIHVEQKSPGGGNKHNKPIMEGRAFQKLEVSRVWVGVLGKVNL